MPNSSFNSGEASHHNPSGIRTYLVQAVISVSMTAGLALAVELRPAITLRMSLFRAVSAWHYYSQGTAMCCFNVSGSGGSAQLSTCGNTQRKGNTDIVIVTPCH